MISGFNSVGTVDNVSANIDAVVTADGTWLRIEWLGGSEHFATSENGIVTLPDHCANWAGVHVLDETWEEFLCGKISVVGLKVSLSWSAKFHSNKLKSFSLES